MRTQFGTILAAAVAVTLHGVASGAVITNANDVTVNVELGSSWVGGVAPGASDTAVFIDVNTSTRFKAGTDLSWYGLEWRRPQVSSVVNGVGMSAATGTETLTISAGGMTFVPNLTGGPRAYINMPVAANAAQSWQGKTNGNDGYIYPHFTGPVTINANLAISTEGSKSIFVFHEPITVATGSKITVSGTFPTMLLQDNARIAGALDIAGGGFCLAPTNEAPVHFSDLVSSIVNNGRFYLGGHDDRCYSGHAISVLFGVGDTLTTTTSSLDRKYSSLRVYDANVTVDGGDLRTRWFRLRNGCWTLKSGNVWFDYQNVIGGGTIHSNRIVKAQTFNVQGGNYKFRRVAVGVANSDEIPARLLVSGGTVESDLLNPIVNNNAEWYSGLDIAVRWIKDEKENDSDKGNQFVSLYAAGDVLVSDNGKLSVPRISFGGNTALSASATTVTNGAGRLRMTGGEIEMGTAGFVLGDLWGPADKAWYEVTFSGGKLTTLSNGAKQNMKVRLSNADGGVAYDVGSGHTYTVGSPMFGSGGLVKTGAGTMVLNCGNDYTGRTEVAAGSLVVKSASAATGTAYTPAGTTCPNATVRLVADDLAAANGASVSSWSAHSGSSLNTEFTLANAQNAAILGTGATAPVVTTDGFNGHKALSFDGVSSALTAGGAGAPWVTASSDNGATAGFSVAMVVRFNGWGEGTSASSWMESRPFFGTTKSGHGPGYVWNFALTGAGQLQGGSAWAPKDNKVLKDWRSPITARPVPRFLDDGRPHVVVMTFPTYNQADGKVTMTVDGYRSENPSVWTNATTLGYGRSYTMLGGSDLFNKKYYTPCSIAEIRFWRDTQLSEAQIKAFSEEMAATYGAELDGYTTFGVSGQHSKEVHVASGASYGTDEANFTLPLYAGQTLSGAGSVIGKMSAQAGSTIALSASGSPTFADLTLADGATIKIAVAGAAALTATNLTIGANDVIDVDVSAVADARHSVNLISFTSGTATADNFRVVPANPLYLFKVLDGKVRLSCINGTQILFR